MPDRVIAYVDGFNLYHGIRSKKWGRYLWLDIGRMARRLLAADQVLVTTKYFTARVAGPPASVARQSTFLSALETVGGIEIIYGRFQKKSRRCRSCGAEWRVSEEKDTDVNIAVQMMRDAAADRFDVALLVSADSDLCPPILAIGELHPEKRVVVAFPPDRRSFELTRVCPAQISVGRGVLAQCQMPTPITTASGKVLERPSHWT